MIFIDRERIIRPEPRVASQTGKSVAKPEVMIGGGGVVEGPLVVGESEASERWTLRRQNGGGHGWL